jgi:phosphatidylglycerophosphate synthase
MTSSVLPRRALATREAGWARTLAGWLGSIGVRPNAVSIASVGFACIASLSFYFASNAAGPGRAGLLLASAAGIQLRLLCNLLDGMLAIEGGLSGKTGELFNEIPDRIADVLILVGAGYSVRHLPGGEILGWSAALLAVSTAYLRVLGGSLGAGQHFTGPMAKQHRMFTLTIAALLAAMEATLGLEPQGVRLGLSVVVAWSVPTLYKRTRLIASSLRAK